MKNYWLLKSEADCYSIDNMKKDKRVPWTGIRNYQARNFMRDQMQPGDLAFFYHSNGDPNGIVGIVEVVSLAHPDETQFDKKDDHFDPKSKKENPTWMCVDVKFKEKFSHIVSLAEIKIRPDLSGNAVTQKGSRLSVMPMSETHFNIISKLGRSDTK